MSLRLLASTKSFMTPQNMPRQHMAFWDSEREYSSNGGRLVQAEKISKIFNLSPPELCRKMALLHKSRLRRVTPNPGRGYATAAV